MVHDRRVDDQILELEMSGEVKLGNLIMYDKGTDTRWLQMNGEALKGALKGKSLKALDTDQVQKAISFGEWKKLHPDSKVLWCDHCFSEGK